MVCLCHSACWDTHPPRHVHPQHVHPPGRYTPRQVHPPPRADILPGHTPPLLTVTAASFLSINKTGTGTSNRTGNGTGTSNRTGNGTGTRNRDREWDRDGPNRKQWFPIPVHSTLEAYCFPVPFLVRVPGSSSVQCESLNLPICLSVDLGTSGPRTLPVLRTGDFRTTWTAPPRP